ncbi:MAG: lamin tail domain-containing protein [Gemmatimonadetes bacterium]|nr:lamin tail domain-containing protein [Gemmatimonadota bacterium]
MTRRTLSAVTTALALALLASCAPDRNATGPDALSRNAAAQSLSLAAGIKVNEVESSGGVPGDWVEFYNAGSVAVDLGGYQFLDNDNTHTPYVIPANTIVQPGGFLVLDETQLGFGLGAGDEARLFAPDGTTLVDSYAWTAHSSLTYGRCPDGTGAWATTSISTKGAANDCSVLIRINEVESQNGVPGDWVELYNPSSSPVDIGGYVFRDNGTVGYTLPAGTTIPANGYYVIDEAALPFGIGAPDEARLFRPDGTTLVDSYAWSAHAATTYGRCPDGTGGFVTTAAPTKGAANSCAAPATSVKINEVESNGGVPGDWVELYNTSVLPVDLGGYYFRDNDNTRQYIIPANTVIQPGGFLVLDEAQFGFGLGAGDQARLFAPGGVTLIDSYTWTAHASTTYARCPDGTGAFQTAATSTKGAANDCGAGVVHSPWPGAQTITTADAGGVFGGNMSGLFYQPLAGLPTGIVWAVKNGPGTLYRLTLVNGVWTPKAARTWTNGKALRYPNGTGDVDAEGVTVVGTNVYVAAERNNAANSVSRNSILRYSVATEAGSVLVANMEWNLTPDLPANGANLGLEAITRVPDSYLVAQGFYDESKARAYNPADYPNNGGGLFFVGVEATGNVYAYALDHANGTYTRVATFSSGYTSIMDLTFDTELGHMWATCDNTCLGRSAVLKIDTQVASPLRGRFVVTQRFDRPTGMPDLNNEGFTYGPLAECVNGTRPALWADDGETGGFALRRGFITCSPF